MDQRNEEYERPSKSHRKREMSELLSTVKELESLSLKELEASIDQGLKQKILELQRINKGSAKKRQRQHIVKFLSKQDKSFAKDDLAKLKASKMTKNQKFHEFSSANEKNAEKYRNHRKFENSLPLSRRIRHVFLETSFRLNFQNRGKTNVFKERIFTVPERKIIKNPLQIRDTKQQPASLSGGDQVDGLPRRKFTF